jgi:sulfonate transport system substrate-binding protein
MAASQAHLNDPPHSPRSLRLVLSALVTALLTLSAAACGSADAGAEADAVRPDGTVDLSRVTLHIGDQKGGSRALLGAAGLLDDMPYRIRWHEFTSGPPLLEGVASGELDIGGVGNTPPIFAAAAGSDLTAIYANTTTGSVDRRLSSAIRCSTSATTSGCRSRSTTTAR